MGARRGEGSLPCKTAPHARLSLAPHLLLPPFLVLLQAPDLLQQAAPLLSQPHDLLIGISVILCPPPQGPTTFT